MINNQLLKILVPE